MNILVDSSGRACVADFGLSSVTDSQIAHWASHSAAASTGGSLRWQAPELNDPEHDEVVHNTKESDMYAWGCVCYEVRNWDCLPIFVMLMSLQIFTGFLPFHELPREPLVTVRVSVGQRPTRPPQRSSAWMYWGLTDTIWELMEDCWRHRPVDRPVVKDVIARLSSAERIDDRPAGSWAAGMSASQFRNTVGEGYTYPTLDDIEVILSEVS